MKHKKSEKARKWVNTDISVQVRRPVRRPDPGTEKKADLKKNGKKWWTSHLICTKNTKYSAHSPLLSLQGQNSLQGLSILNAGLSETPFNNTHFLTLQREFNCDYDGCLYHKVGRIFVPLSFNYAADIRVLFCPLDEC